MFVLPQCFATHASVPHVREYVFVFVSRPQCFVMHEHLCHTARYLCETKLLGRARAVVANELVHQIVRQIAVILRGEEGRPVSKRGNGGEEKTR